MRWNAQPTSVRRFVGLVARSLGRSFRWPIAKVATWAIIGSVFQSFIPVALKHAVNDITATHFASAVGAIVIYIGVGTGARMSQALLIVSFGSAWRKLQSIVGMLVYDHVIALPHSYHLSRRTGEMSRIISDGLAGTRSILYSLVYGVVPILLQALVIGVIVLRSYPATFLCIFVTFGILYGLIFYRGLSRQREIQRRASREDSATANEAVDALLNHETIKLFGGERTISARIRTAFLNSEEAWFSFFRAQAANRVVLTCMFSCSICTVLILAAHAAGHLTMTPGDFVLVNAYMLQLIEPIELLGSSIRELTQGLTYLERMAELMDLAPESFQRGSCELSGIEPLEVQVRDLFFGYHPGRQVLKGVTFSIPKGRTVAVVGTSGSGKSTLSRLLFGLYRPTRGSIFVDGTSIDDFRLDSLRSAFAIVPQDTVLFNDTIAMNIAFGRPGATEQEVIDAATLAGLTPVLDALPDRWQTIVGERGLRLSGGEKQRVAIARAILKRPRMFVFDEATSALDTQTEHLIQNSLFYACRGVTALIIAHRLSTIKDADEILVLDQGRIVERGHHHSLLAARGCYAAMWDAQSKDSMASR